MELLTIGQLAKRAQVSVETIRYYEREALIAKPQRSAAGYRQYAPEVVRRLRFIQRAKELGFTLKEILELLSLRTKPGVCCGDVRAQARLKIADIEARIASLQQMKRALQTLAQECAGSGPVSECPILEALDSEQEMVHADR